MTGKGEMKRGDPGSEVVHLLVFELEGHAYGLDVDGVEAVVEGRASDGAWSYEGEEVTVESLAGWVGLNPPSQSPTRILLCRNRGGLRGFEVDTPKSIVTLAVDDIYPLPSLIRRVLGQAPLWGVGRAPGGLLLLVDLDKTDTECATEAGFPASQRGGMESRPT
jgi:chemotaxis signal transduction protein